MKRTKEIRFRLTTEEKERLIIAAKRAGYTQSGYTRAAIEFASLRSRLPTLWSRSYYVGSVGHVSEETVRKYIEAQKGK